MLTQQQLDERKTGIGGSDAGTVLGLNRYKTPLELWLEKTGRMDAPDLSDNEAVHWGTILEDIIASEFTRRTWKSVRRSNKTHRHPQHQFMLAHVDRLINGGGILEIKTTNAYANNWGEPGTDQIPEHYLAQVAHYMSVLDRDWCKVAVLIGGQRMEIYHVDRNQELEHALIEAESKFWDLVQSDIPPEPQSISDINAMWPHDAGKQIIATPDVEIQISELRRIKSEIRDLQLIASKLEADIKSYMEEAAELSADDGHILATWKTQKSTRLDAKRFREEYPGVAKQYMNETETRVFRIKQEKQNEK